MDGKKGYFPGEYALPLRPGQQVYQVTAPYSYKLGGRDVRLFKDQVRSFSEVDDVFFYHTVRFGNSNIVYWMHRVLVDEDLEKSSSETA